ncbi:hsp70 nucleotide exchange factor fes1 [Chytridiales sp. JEL 0842]|nr:hsp70 nucleotide exchange factor fes1 [Chytridiales sp. JEL 0842]
MPSKPLTHSDLLQWSILNTATANEDAPARSASDQVKHEKIDPKWVDIILGKPDAVRMKELVELISDTAKSSAERLSAFDELEMLVESLDNANDLRKLGLWGPILKVFKEDGEEEIRGFAGWVVSTALQNNEVSKGDFLQVGGLEPLLDSIQNETSELVRFKSIACLTALLKHNPEALQLCSQPRNDDGKTGIEVMMSVLDSRASSKDLQKAQKRVLFFWGNVVRESLEGGDEEKVLESVVKVFAEKGRWAESVVGCLESMKEERDLDTIEAGLGLVVGLAEVDSTFVSGQERTRLQSLMKEWEGKVEFDEELKSKVQKLFS